MRIPLLLVLTFLGLAGSHAQQTQIVYLSGTGADDTKTWDFKISSGRKSGVWSTIEVPSCWEQQGYGEYRYGHYPMQDRVQETGVYKTSFEVPQDWKGKSVRLVFEGAMTDTRVKINGKQVGEVHQGGFYEFSYDIGRFLKIGQPNQLEVTVTKMSENQSINIAERKADFWIFGGIFRPVYVAVSPKEHISRLAIDAQANGAFKADILLNRFKKADSYNLIIHDLEGNQVHTNQGKIASDSVRIASQVDNIKSWTSETPHLYTATVQLKDKGKLLHEKTERFGFRTVDLRESDGLYVNGVKVKLKGVNRHTFHPDFGRTSSKALSIQAVKLMKEMNMNAVRMSHYPPDKHFLEVCDSLGLFVLDELTGWQRPAYDDATAKRLVKEVVQRDVNHPSILFWDNGNEGGWNPIIDDDFAKYDIQKREVLHPWESFRKTNTIHYTDYGYLALDNYAKRKLFMPTELLHGLYDGGHGAGLEDYWKRIYDHPLGMGAFLWVFADEGIARTDRNGEIDLDGNHAPDGILGPYLEKEASFYTIRKLWSPVQIQHRYLTPGFDGRFRVENRYHFTDLSTIDFKISWIRFDAQGQEAQVTEAHQQMALPPGDKGWLELDLPQNWQENHLLKIEAVDRRGQPIVTYSYPVNKAEATWSQFVKPGIRTPIQQSIEGDLILITTGEMVYGFDRTNGRLLTVKRKGKTIPLAEGPIFVSTEQKAKSVTYGMDTQGQWKLTATMEKSGDSFQWRLDAEGRLHLKVAYQPAKRTPYAGIGFRFPEKEVKGLRYMGEGPQRVWKNRMQGTQFGIWGKKYNQTQTGHSGWEYPEYKGYHANLYWMRLQTKNQTDFSVYAKTDDVFLGLFTPEQPEDARQAQAAFPDADLSFLQGIAPIGTKFHKTEELGPQSQLNQFRSANFFGGRLQMELVFDFR